MEEMISSWKNLIRFAFMLRGQHSVGALMQMKKCVCLCLCVCVLCVCVCVCVCVCELPSSNPGFVLIFFHVFWDFNSSCFILCLTLHISLMQPSFTLLNTVLHLELLKQFSKKI